MPEAGKGISCFNASGAPRTRTKADGNDRSMRLHWVLLLLSLSAASIWPGAMSINLCWDRRSSGDAGVRRRPGDVDFGFGRHEQGTRKGLSSKQEDVRC